MNATQRKSTCGPLYLEALTQYTDGDPEKVRLFAAGFVHGQAEKVHLGACLACMFRPSGVNSGMVRGLADDAAQRYGLLVVCLNDEVWLCRNAAVRFMVESLAGVECNSAAWHVKRANLCGVWRDEIDPKFHERKGYGEACDAVPEKGAREAKALVRSVRRLAVWKFAAPITGDEEEWLLPRGATVLSVQMQGEAAILWALVDPAAEPEARRFRWFATGEPIVSGEGMQFVATVQLPNSQGGLVFHLFELGKEPR